MKNQHFYKINSLSGWLKKIIEHKLQELQSSNTIHSFEKTIKNCSSCPEANHFFNVLKQPAKNCVTGNFRLIAEYKVKSPSHSKPANYDLNEIISIYQNYAHAISIVCDHFFFGGNIDNIQLTHNLLQSQEKTRSKFPILYKEFIVSPQQIYSAYIYKANAVLLMASVLTKDGLRQAITLTQKLNLTAVIEIANLEEWHIVKDLPVLVVGVNNRNLTDLTIDLKRSQKLLDKIPSRYLRIVESGIVDQESISKYKGLADVFLVGTSIMRSKNPEKKIQKLGWQKRHES